MSTEELANKLYLCRKTHRIGDGLRTDSAILAAIEDALGGCNPDQATMDALWMDATAIGCEIREAIKCNTP